MLATVQDLVDRFDRQLLADLARDDGLAESDLAGNPRVLSALKDASGEVRSAILQGRRYTMDDLAALEEDDAAFLKRLVCTRAMLNLAAARVSVYGEENYRAAAEWVEEKLSQLARGERIFGTPAAQDAGLPRTEAPLLVEVQRMNLLVDRCEGYYPNRADRMAR
jgi:phage gp36-like protein